VNVFRLIRILRDCSVSRGLDNQCVQLSRESNIDCFVVTDINVSRGVLITNLAYSVLPVSSQNTREDGLSILVGRLGFQIESNIRFIDRSLMIIYYEGNIVFGCGDYGYSNCSLSFLWPSLLNCYRVASHSKGCYGTQGENGCCRVICSREGHCRIYWINGERYVSPTMISRAPV